MSETNITSAERNAFLALYNDQWDYTHCVFQRGSMYHDFCKKNGLRMPENPPVHFNDVPKEQRDAYKAYMVEQLAAFWDTTTTYVKLYYTLDSAIKESMTEIREYLKTHPEVAG